MRARDFKPFYLPNINGYLLNPSFIFEKKVMKKKGEDEQEKGYELLFILDSLLVDDTLKRRALTCKSLFWL